MPEWRSRWRLILLNSLTCGLEICVAAGITYVPPLLLEAGVQEQYMTMVLGIGPVLGLLFIPLIGSASDHCNSIYGRRWPFIWLLSLGVLLALFIIPHADALAASLWGGQRLHVGLLILGVGLLDFCGQLCFTPLEALLSDLYHDPEDYNQAFAMFSFMVSLGGCVGYLLPALDWSQGLLSVYLGGQAECLFSLLIAIFLFSALITLRVSDTSEPSSSFLETNPLKTDCWGSCLCCYLLRCKFRCLKSGALLCLLQSCCSVTPAIYRSYCDVPRVVRQLCIAQLCSWIAVMSFMLFYTDFVGEALYDGVPSAAPGSTLRQRYDEGIRMGSLGLFLQCATSTLFSLFMNRLVCAFGSRAIYLSSMACFTVSAMVICMSKSIVVVTTMSALTGFAYATLQTLPYTLTCQYHKDKEVYMPKGKGKLLGKTGGLMTRDTLHFKTLDPTEGFNLKPGSGNASAHVSGRERDPRDRERGEYFPLQTQQHHQTAFPPGFIEQDDDHNTRGVGLDFAILDSTFLLSQVFPTLFMGMIVQFTQSVTAYIACSAIFGTIAIGLANQVIFDQKDLRC